MIMCKIFKTFVFIIIVVNDIFSQQISHFSDVVDSTGNAHIVIIEDIEKENSQSDVTWYGEIGIFDGEILVGSEVISNNLPLSVTSWLEFKVDSINLAGAKIGSPIIIKYWDRLENQEYSTSIVFESGGIFGYIPLTIIEKIIVLESVSNVKIVKYTLPVFNISNPTNRHNLENLLSDNNYKFEIINILGQSIRCIDHLSPGVYFIKVINKSNNKILDLKKITVYL